MNHDGAVGGGRMTMQFLDTTPASPSWSASSSAADLADPNPYSSIFFPPSSSNSDQSTSPTGATPTTASSASDLSLLMLEHQDLLSRFKIRLSQLQKTFREAETLRQENTNLRVAYGDLSHRLNRLAEANLGQQYGPSSPSLEIATPPPVFSKVGGLDLARWESGEIPIGVIESERVLLPKSISVRSNGFLKVAGQIAPKATSTGPSRGVNRIRPVIPVEAPQKVYVRGGNKEEGAMQVEVQNQGMFKTELCNKWQDTGSCPYGEHCQFAHGFEELRPVLRHPRYKTEVCRMVLAGETCPYGHRCHFRHALTQQEQLMLPLNLD